MRVQKTTQELYEATKERAYLAGMLSMICIYEGPYKAALAARQLRQPIEVALYAVRIACPPMPHER